MKLIDQYPQMVAWSAEDEAYVGYCLSVFPGGGVCHGDDPVEVLRQLRGLMDEELERYAAEGWELPAPASVDPCVPATLGRLAAA